MILKNGQTTEDPKLDRIFQEDWNTLRYTVGTQFKSQITDEPRSMDWECELWLDQGEEGACVGFAFAHELFATPAIVTGLNNNWGKDIYHTAQMRDQWPGGSYAGASPFYEGTSVLAGAQELTNRKFYSGYYWALSVEEMARGIAYFGPAVIGVNWYTGMYNTDAQGFIKPIGGISGGHAILVKGIKIVWKSAFSKLWGGTWRDVDFDKSYFILHNSWGKSWGQNGRAKISLTHMQLLIQQQGEVCFPKRSIRESVDPNRTTYLNNYYK